MSVRRRGLMLPMLLLCSGAACGGKTVAPRDQWTVVVATDAPLPQFGDRLLIEVLDDQGDAACAGCRRQLGIPKHWPISFGIMPLKSSAPMHVRVRLYRSAATGGDGLPLGYSLIDALGTLPDAHGDAHVYLKLGMDCFGMLASPTKHRACDPKTGKLGAEQVLRPLPSSLPAPGSWPKATERDCEGAAPDGMVCVPGGVFLLGSPRLFIGDPDRAPTPEHLVRLSPYALDADEFSVKAMRELVMAGKVDAPLKKGVDAGSDMCTWLGVNDSTDDALPVNCVSYAQADAACRTLGKRLPTEAEWEFAAANRTQETSYPWGEDGENPCEKAVVAREAGATGPGYCLFASGGVAGPAAGGNKTDATALGIRNLAGNVSEWVADWFSPYSAGCWNRPGLLVDPVCATPTATSGGDERSIRGAAWSSTAAQAKTYARTAGPPNKFYLSSGFRCARSM